MVEFRRDRAMEERRAGAANVVVNNDIGGPVRNEEAKTENDLAKLANLKQMLEQGLIEQHEFDAKKRDILDRM